MKICKMASVLLSVILSVSMLVTPAGVMADDSSSEETQKTEVTETETTVTEATEPIETTEKETEAAKPEATAPKAKRGELPKTVVKKKPSNAYSNKLGKNITWTIDDNGVFTVSGTGKMPSIANNARWKQYAATAKAVVIENGITSICDNAFAYCSGIAKLTLAGSVTTIGNGAFRETGITNLKIPNGVKTIQDYAFFSCKKLTSVRLAKSVSSLGIKAFGSCTNLDSVYITAQLFRALTPQFIFGDYNPFYDCPNKVFILTTKYTNFLNVTGKTAKVKYKKLKKRNLTLARGKVLSISDYQGTISFTKLSGNKKISINNKTGKVTIKKKLKKGTYIVRVRVSATGDADYAAASYAVTFRIKVK